MIIIEGHFDFFISSLATKLQKDFQLTIDNHLFNVVGTNAYDIVYRDFKKDPFIIYQGHEIIRKLAYPSKDKPLWTEECSCWKALYLTMHTSPLVIYSKTADVSRYDYIMESINSHNPVSNPVVYYDGSEDAYEKGVKPRVRKYLDHHASIPRVSLPTIFPEEKPHVK